MDPSRAALMTDATKALYKKLAAGVKPVTEARLETAKKIITRYSGTSSR